MRAIAAMASNRVIGKDGTLPWRIKGDLKFFKKMTDGCICVVGRKTYDTLPYLPNRKFVVETKQIDRYELGIDPKTNNHICGLNMDPTGSHIPVYSGRDDAWIIGGASIYQSMLPFCTDLYLTRIYKPYDGDTLFPLFEHMFDAVETVEEAEEYEIIHYKRKANHKV